VLAREPVKRFLKFIHERSVIFIVELELEEDPGFDIVVQATQREIGAANREVRNLGFPNVIQLGVEQQGARASVHRV
jgi:hypothetical protein